MNRRTGSSKPNFVDMYETQEKDYLLLGYTMLHLSLSADYHRCYVYPRRKPFLFFWKLDPVSLYVPTESNLLFPVHSFTLRCFIS